jgi:predicted phage tail component-like protein
VTPNNFKIIYEDGREIDMYKDLNVIVNSFSVSSPDPIVYSQSVSGRDGAIYTGTDIAPRNITVVCTSFARNVYDYPLLKNRIAQVLFSEKRFYVIKDDEPSKRWKVTVSTSYDTIRTADIGDFTINFTALEPYAESIKDSLEDMDFDPEYWQWGQGIPLEEIKYVHNTNEFTIFNIGDVTVDPRQHGLVIEYKGSSNNLEISNTTTNETFIYNGNSNQGDVISLDRVRFRRNGLNIVGSTNRVPITLRPGENKININGTNGAFEISFKFRFLYL